MAFSGGSAATEAEWPDLEWELDRWGETGRVAGVWWRDDDAVAMTPCLERLFDLVGETPLALAVIPAEADGGLAAAIETRPRVSVLPHGWRHVNNATTGKKSEFPAGRGRDEVAADLAAAQRCVAAIFGMRALPVFVPPWNRFAEEFVPLLSEAGITGLSLMAPRRYVAATPGIAVLDADVDLVDWHGGRGFIGEGAALGGIVAALLRARRKTGAEATTSVGILSHHLVLDEAGAAFLRRFRQTVDAHPAARWVAAAEFLT
jgi:hypothetical protein